MRRLELIINEARLSTNTTDVASVSNLLCQGYMNRITSYLEDLLFLENDENDLFMADYIFDLVIGQDEYPVPPHIYAKSSIDNLAVSFLNGLSNTYLPLKKISRKNLGFMFGYFVRDNVMVMSPRPTSPLSMKLAYVRKLPSVGIRGGVITAVTATTITISGYVPGFEGLSDFISTVDFNGNVLATGLQFSFDGVSVFTVPSTTYSVTTIVNNLNVVNTYTIPVGAYVISGFYASSHSQLPDECEKYLIIALERMIQYRQSSPDINTSTLFSEEELKAIKEVFADNSYDDAKPPVTEWQEWLP